MAFLDTSGLIINKLIRVVEKVEVKQGEAI
uniref:Uncharacterized protein n=1 Tax=Anguilla anguilla TaxID=7936 RepID=A0A0E9VCX7_ANGAN